ncbi:MAG: hybrid sensor histidine kinase/response regulator [Campylobacteraceae bacterium]|nr:hybrid sensor histidine kinase/response regulator [Campylobacteraceae bacterium]
MKSDIIPSLLIVDDNEKNLQATKRILDDLNINIHTVLSGEDALKAIISTEFFLILLDVQMPVMDGFETASIIHGNDNYKNIPIIFLTAIKKDEEYIRTGYEEGAVDYMLKPFNAHTLISKTKVFLELYMSKKELEASKNIAENKTLELNELNKNLEMLVAERTKVLNESLETLKLTQQQMIESEKMAALGGLVAGVAHEINTPIGVSLTGITHLKHITDSLNRLYEDQEMSQDKFEEYLKTCMELDNTIHSNLERAAELIRSFKRISVDETSDESYVLFLAERIDHVVFSLQNNLKHTNIKVEIDCDKSIQVNTYPGAIYQIFTNFFTNSLMHAYEKDEEGTIRIEVFVEDGKIHMVYKDDGKGIPPEVLPKIFDPFFTTNRSAGGTGLGLHIIYNLVFSRLKGTIKATSTVGQGAQFEVVFASLPSEENETE